MWPLWIDKLILLKDLKEILKPNRKNNFTDFERAGRVKSQNNRIEINVIVVIQHLGFMNSFMVLSVKERLYLQERARDFWAIKFIEEIRRIRVNFAW